MATIYDVAQKAGVAISTVSNYLNNKYISPERRKAIQEAIEVLNYVPSQSAKRLKTKKSNQIAVILPSIEERVYAEILTGALEPLKQSGYNPVLYLTDDIDIAEENALKECLSSDYAGVILCTCNPTASELFTLILKRMPLVFVLRKPARMQNANFITFNDEETIYNIASFFIRNDHEDIVLLTGPMEYSNELSAANGFKNAFTEFQKPIGKVVVLPSSKADIFNRLMHILTEFPIPKLIITTSTKISAGLLEAIQLRGIGLNMDVNVIALSEDSWLSPGSQLQAMQTNRPAKKLGTLAAETLTDNIKSKKSFEFVIRQLQDEFKYSRLRQIDENLKRFTSVPIKPTYTKKIKVLLTQNDNISDIIKYILPNFKNLANVDVELETLPQTEIYNELMAVKNEQKSEYDLFAIDVPWLTFFAQNNCLMDISDVFNPATLNSAFTPETLQRFGKYQDRLYGLPYLNATQLLYYRKDLFEDSTYQKEFSTIFDKPLEVPKTWFDYNLIAKFFTKKYNPKSPLDYGTSITQVFHEALMGELYPRMWSYGGTVFDRHGRVHLYSNENIAAFKSMISSIKCSDPNLSDINAYEKTKQFAQGQTAMIIAYHHHACVISDRSISNIQGKVGYDLIPGKTPILAGWSMGVNQYTKNMDTAATFLKWMLSMQSSISYTVLGGISARENTYHNSDLLKLYPWFSLVPESSLNAMPRSTPLIDNRILVSEAQVEIILANVIFAHLNNKAPIENGLAKAEEEIKTLCAASGYQEPTLI